MRPATSLPPRQQKPPRQGGPPSATSRRAAVNSDDFGPADLREGHFLERTLRFSDQELTRAMKLYHHSALVRGILAGQLEIPSGHKPADVRVAIALGEPGQTEPSGHVILTGAGNFVTCLAAHMKVGDRRVLPYHLFAPAMEAEDRTRIDSATERDQLSRLSIGTLLEGLILGPHGITREQATQIARRPLTYLFPTLFTLYNTTELGARLEKCRNLMIDDHWQGAEVAATWQSVDQALQKVNRVAILAIYLLAGMEEPSSTQALYELSVQQVKIAFPATFALSHHRRGGELFLSTLQNRHLPVSVRRVALFGITLHSYYHPDNVVAIGKHLRDNPPADLPADGTEILPAIQSFDGSVENWPDGVMQDECLDDPDEEPGDLEWILPIPWYVRMARRRAGLPQLFHPAKRTAAVRAAWEQKDREPVPPPPPKPVVQQIVRSGPRTGRNDPCPCGSGRKFKHCCQGAAQRPAPAAPSPTS